MKFNYVCNYRLNADGVRSEGEDDFYRVLWVSCRFVKPFEFGSKSKEVGLWKFGCFMLCPKVMG